MANLLRVKDLAQRLGVSVQTIYDRTSKKKKTNVKFQIPPWLDTGSRLKLWLEEDVEEWLRTRKRIKPRGAND